MTRRYALVSICNHSLFLLFRYSNQTGSQKLKSIQTPWSLQNSFSFSQSDSLENGLNQSLCNSANMKENSNKRFSRESSVDKYSALNGYHDSNEDSKEPYNSSMEALLNETSDNERSKVPLPDFSHTINTNFSMVSNDINKTLYS